MSSSSSTPVDPNYRDGSREGRLKFSKRAEQHLRDELALHARKECKDALGAFAACAKENGMFVVFKCRGLNNAMNACLSEYTSESKFEEWKKTRGMALSGE
ncbi:cytochrome c oxidase biogenesis protein [Nannochloropsis oceanica]